MIPGTDKVHVRLSGIDAQVHICGGIKFLQVIPLKVAAANFTNLTADFVF